MWRVKDINSIPLTYGLLLAKEGFEHREAVIFSGKVFVARAKELFTWNPSFHEPKESVYTSDDESKHGAKILNDGAHNSDVESDDECNVDGVSETIFSDNVDECDVDGHGVRDASTSLSHPPGFTPKTSVTHANVGDDSFGGIILLDILHAFGFGPNGVGGSVAANSIGLGMAGEQTQARYLNGSPKGVLKTMESIRSKFFNGVDSSDRTNFVDFPFVCSSTRLDKEIVVANKIGASSDLELFFAVKHVTCSGCSSVKFVVGGIWMQGRFVLSRLGDAWSLSFRLLPSKSFRRTNLPLHKEAQHKITTIGFIHYPIYTITQDNQDRDLVLRRKKEKSLDYNNSFLGEYECSSLALDREERRDEKKRLDHLKQDQTMLVIKRFSERKKVFRERKKTGKIRAKRGFEQDIDDEGEEDKEDEEGDGEV
ncbi:hypothetical protein Tco_1133899 [Tanacetum coccineum]